MQKVRHTLPSGMISLHSTLLMRQTASAQYARPLPTPVSFHHHLFVTD